MSSRGSCDRGWDRGSRLPGLLRLPRCGSVARARMAIVEHNSAADARLLPWVLCGHVLGCAADDWVRAGVLVLPER